MAVDAASAEEMVRTAEESGVFLTVGHQARFYPSAQALHGELRAGRFGALYFARASMVRRMGIPTWGRFFDPVVPGGRLPDGPGDPCPGPGHVAAGRL